MKKDLILIGKQGSGKGTQAKILAKLFGFQIFETGGALRAIAQENSALGKTVKDITTRGDLVPNEVVMDIVRDFLKKNAKNGPVIFDGIPRSDEQRVTLESLLSEMKREFQALEIRLTNKEALHRLMIRATCNDCGLNFGSEDDICPKCSSKNISRRADDNPESILKRLENFDKYTAPLMEVWRKAGKMISVDGEQDVADVTTEVLGELGLE
jgi:adenylate kinase